MTAAEWADVIKDGLGFLGAVMTAVPWFIDYFNRRSLEKISKIPTEDQATKAFLDKAVSKVAEYLTGPRRCDLLLQIGGLMLVAISFATSALKGLGVFDIH